MWLEADHRDLTLTRSVDPEHPSRSRRVVLQVRLEDLAPEAAAQVADLVGFEPRVERIITKVGDRLRPLPEQLPVVGIERLVLVALQQRLPELQVPGTPFLTMKGTGQDSLSRS
jgi:hypothetical protein